MDVREKLVELLQDENNPVWRWFPNNMAMMQLADYLIANGVTVQEWISVKDRLPEENEIILAWVAACRDLHFCFGSEVSGLEVTHWMPLPQPPKGE